MKTTEGGAERFRDRVMARVDGLSASERAVTDFMLNRPAEAVTATAAELASLTGTSDATVVRTARSLGYGGLRELKRAVLDMLAEPRDMAVDFDRKLEHLGGARVFDQVVADSADLLRRMPDVIDPDAFDRAVEVIAGAERTIAYGIGPASAAARYFSIELNRQGRRCSTMEATGFRLADDLLNLSSDDVVLVFAPLRIFREISALITRASEVGAPVVVIAEALGAAVRDRVDAVITTPSSTAEAAGENLAGWVVAHAMIMELAARDRSGSVAARQRLNQLRHEIGGPEIDTYVLGVEGAEPPA